MKISNGYPHPINVPIIIEGDSTKHYIYLAAGGRAKLDSAHTPDPGFLLQNPNIYLFNDDGSKYVALTGTSSSYSAPAQSSSTEG